MNGAESLVRTLVNGEVNVCFANPGTSEMHFVSALDRVEGVRCILGLFEGVVTGAADGYYRMTGKPAATLLHLGPGLGNGLSNLHNAKKARSGMVNIVGEHATYHVKHDAPLTADIEGVARPMSDWVKTSRASKAIAADGALAIEAARVAPGQIATLILPADTAWGEADGPAQVAKPAPPAGASADAIKAGARALQNGAAATLLLGNAALKGKALDWAGRIAAKTGCGLWSEAANARVERGAGRPPVAQLPFLVDPAVAALKNTRQLVLVGAKIPVAFFAYPNKPSVLIAPGCEVIHVAAAENDLEAALEALAGELNARDTPPLAHGSTFNVAPPAGPITLEGLGDILNALIPANAIVLDEAITSGRTFTEKTMGARPHDWLSIVGGSIGWGMAAAVGAALGAPDRKVVALLGDGSALYTQQALWTMAREQLDVTVVIFANRAYKVLFNELANVGAQAPGKNAISMLSLAAPAIDWLAIAKGFGAAASRATNLEELALEFKRALAHRGPYLVEVVF
ncbi:MAG: acetolactate synthase large subunit [Betaproteobacteria bacterium]|nr:acetolactate synthase large subunit [Betaproteobacteria bacterium]